MKLKEIEKKYGIDFGEEDTVTLSQYLKKKGLPNLAKLLDMAEIKIPKKNYRTIPKRLLPTGNGLSDISFDERWVSQNDYSHHERKMKLKMKLKEKRARIKNDSRPANNINKVRNKNTY